jgi:hypothetical protein
MASNTALSSNPFLSKKEKACPEMPDWQAMGRVAGGAMIWTRSDRLCHLSAFLSRPASALGSSGATFDGM